MKIIFMGTPEFAVAPLEMLASTNHQLGMVFTQPDKAKGRGNKLQHPPVKARALELGLPVFQPERIRGNQEILDQIRAYGPDLIVVAAYGQLLPKELLEIPEKGCINIHASLLPRLRGAAPIQRAIMEGEEKTGITLMQMAEGLDTGDMLAKAETYVDRKNYQQLHDELALMGAELLREHLDSIEKGTLNPEKQDDTLATYAHRILKPDEGLDFSRSGADLERQIRGLYPAPGATTSYKGEPLKAFVAEAIADPADAGFEISDSFSAHTFGEPGSVEIVDDRGILVKTGKGYLLITEIQVPGKKRMTVRDFLRGHKMELPLVLGR